MKPLTLPEFIEKDYHRLKGASIREENVKYIVSLFDEVISFIGKFSILEYIQQNEKSEQVNYHLFSVLYPDTHEKWMSIIFPILQSISHKEQNFVLKPLQTIQIKYFPTGENLPLQKLSWLSKVSHFEDYALSLADVQESQEILLSLVEDLEFFKKVTYSKNTLHFQEKSLNIELFWHISESKGILKKKMMKGYLKKFFKNIFKSPIENIKKKEKEILIFHL